MKRECGGDKSPAAECFVCVCRQVQHQLEGIAMSDNEESSGLMGWVIFILIFGIGNAILYYFTGVFFIPIPRK